MNSDYLKQKLKVENKSFLKKTSFAHVLSACTNINLASIMLHRLYDLMFTTAKLEMQN